MGVVFQTDQTSVLLTVKACVWKPWQGRRAIVQHRRPNDPRDVPICHQGHERLHVCRGDSFSEDTSVPHHTFRQRLCLRRSGLCSVSSAEHICYFRQRMARDHQMILLYSPDLPTPWITVNNYTARCVAAAPIGEQDLQFSLWNMDWNDWRLLTLWLRDDNYVQSSLLVSFQMPQACWSHLFAGWERLKWMCESKFDWTHNSCPAVVACHIHFR